MRLPQLRTLLSLALLSACTQKVVFQTEKRDGGGAGATGSAGTGGGGPACPNGESVSLDFHPEVSNVIVALDRSTSMNAAFGPSTKLQAARILLSKLVSRYEHSVRFGYVAFPGPGCFQDACCWVQPSPLIQHGYPSFVAALGACDSPNLCAASSERPTAFALAGCLESYARSPPAGLDNVVLISDGPPGCTSANDLCDDAIRQVQELNFRSVRVHVLDLSTQGQDRCLVDLSRIGNGRYDNPDSAEFEGRLDDLLHDIAEDACRLDIETPVVDPNRVTVLYRGEPIRRDRDRVNGWEFNNQFRTITIYGNACDTIVRGGNWEQDVDLVEDCRPPSPSPMN